MVQVDLTVKTAAKGSAVAAATPFRRLPVLEAAPGQLLPRTPAMLRWLARLRSDKTLSGGTMFDKAVVDAFMDVARLWLDTPCAVIRLAHSGTPVPADAVAAARDRVQQAVSLLELHLAKHRWVSLTHCHVWARPGRHPPPPCSFRVSCTRHRFIGGDAMSVADVVFVVLLNRMQSEFWGEPLTRHWFTHLRQEPEFRAVLDGPRGPAKALAGAPAWNPVIIDTDPGIDDVMALFLACAAHKRGEIDLLALTLTQGNHYDMELVCCAFYRVCVFVCLSACLLES